MFHNLHANSGILTHLYEENVKNVKQYEAHSIFLYTILLSINTLMYHFPAPPLFNFPNMSVPVFTCHVLTCPHLSSPVLTWPHLYSPVITITYLFQPLIICPTYHNLIMPVLTSRTPVLTYPHLSPAVTSVLPVTSCPD